MERVTGIYSSGKVILAEPVDWHDGASVSVECRANGEAASAPDLCVDGTSWEDSAEAIRKWVDWFDALKPVLATGEQEAFETALRSARDEQRRWRG